MEMNESIKRKYNIIKLIAIGTSNAALFVVAILMACSIT